MNPEHRAGVEFRVSGRTLSGVALRYGDVSPDFRERFLPGAFGPVDRIGINLQHDRALVVAPDAILTDSPRELRVRADLAPDSAALALVRRGALSGFSIEFHSRAERQEGGLRVIERADLSGLALVDAGAYPASKAEVRARSGRTMRSTVPYDRALACECIAQGGAGAACVPLAKFSKVAGEGMAEALNAAYADAVRDILAVAGNFRRPLASVSKGTLRGRSTEDGLEIEIDLPAGAVGDEIVAANSAAGVIIRPLVDPDRSEYVDTEAGREYSRVHLRAFIVGATDTKAGWPAPRIVETPDDIMPEGERAAPAPSRRLRRLWL